MPMCSIFPIWQPCFFLLNYVHSIYSLWCRCFKFYIKMYLSTVYRYISYNVSMAYIPNLLAIFVFIWILTDYTLFVMEASNFTQRCIYLSPMYIHMNSYVNVSYSSNLLALFVVLFFMYAYSNYKLVRGTSYFSWRCIQVILFLFIFMWIATTLFIL